MARGTEAGCSFSADASQVLLGGGTDASGVLRADTLWLSGCPFACEAQQGPALGGGARGGGLARLLSWRWLDRWRRKRGRTVERVTFTAGDPVVEAFAVLETARSGVSLFELDAGILYVGGGRTADGFSAEVEVCFPDELAF